MDEATKRLWDVRLGILGPVVTVAAILVGVWQFNAGEDHRRLEDREASIAAAKLEMRKDQLQYRALLRQQKVQTFSAVATLAGQIVAAPSGTGRRKAEEAFEAAYWGATVLVDDETVQNAMRDFHNELHDEATGWRSDPSELKKRAFLLAQACNRSLAADLAATP